MAIHVKKACHALCDEERDDWGEVRSQGWQSPVEDVSAWKMLAVHEHLLQRRKTKLATVRSTWLKGGRHDGIRKREKIWSCLERSAGQVLEMLCVTLFVRHDLSGRTDASIMQPAVDNCQWHMRRSIWNQTFRGHYSRAAIAADIFDSSISSSRQPPPAPLQPAACRAI